MLVTYNPVQHQHAGSQRCTSHLCVGTVQVANEAAVLSAVRQYAQLQESNGMRDSVMERVRRSSIMPEEVLSQFYRSAAQDSFSALLGCSNCPVGLTFRDMLLDGQTYVLQTGHLTNMSRQVPAGQCDPCMLTELTDVLLAAAALRETSPAGVDCTDGQHRAGYMADELSRHQGGGRPLTLHIC